uniref:Uncharacterized protein n=1 Tax=Arundo donax TaxID=35708 RepID=A0A0A8Y0Z0_ARUDO
MKLKGQRRLLMRSGSLSMLIERQKGSAIHVEIKRGKNHKCPEQVYLHIIEELLEILQIDEGPQFDSSDDEEELDEVVLAVQQNPSRPRKKRKTMRFRGFIGKQEVLILVDSCSVGTFISDSMAQKLQYPIPSCEEERYSAADGGHMLCSQIIPQLQWFIQGHTFSQDVKVLPLKCYDLILGADWLEDHSPMSIHWGLKCMRFTHNRHQILLQGIQDDVSKCPEVSAKKLDGLIRRGAVTHLIEFIPSHMVCAISDSSSSELPVELQSLLQEFSELFKEPTDLPSQRQFGHHIPLVPGAQPINMRPYHS